MITLTITGEVVGQAHFYEKTRRRGRRILVPSYRAIAYDQATGEQLIFAVTRDCQLTAFNTDTAHRYQMYGECPPNREEVPYTGKIGTHSNGTFCIRLSEPELFRGRNQLFGAGEAVRSDIMIHVGPGTSVGCLMVAGGMRALRRLEKWLTERIDSQTTIAVTVKERSL